MTKNLAIVLAAGKGSRMKSDIPKPLQIINGKTMVYTIVEKLFKSNLFEKILVVVGVESTSIRSNLEDSFWCSDKKSQLIKLTKNIDGSSLDPHAVAKKLM